MTNPFINHPTQPDPHLKETQKQAKTNKIAARDLEMWNLYIEGKTLQEIGDTYGLSRERIRQRLEKFEDYGSYQARAWRKEKKAQELNSHVEEFITKYGNDIRNKVQNGATRQSIAESFPKDYPDYPTTIWPLVAKRMKLVFDVDRSNFAHSDASVTAAVWFTVATIHEAASDHIDVEDELGNDLDDIKEHILVTVEDEEAADEILTTVAAGKKHIETSDKSESSITKLQFDRVREDFIDAWGRTGEANSRIWPTTSQTVMKRLGGGFWTQALEACGVESGSALREYNRTYSEQDMWDAVDAFYKYCVANDLHFVASNYDKWADHVREENPGVSYPSFATLRNRLGKWSSVKRHVIDKYVS